MARLIPERTVDSLFAYEVLHAMPSATIWSPSNTAGSWDHEVTIGQARLLVVECKAVDRTSSGHWRIPIDRGQLTTYAQRTPQVAYLLPAKPSRARPWTRACYEQSCARGQMCLACHVPYAGNPRRWAGRLGRLGRAPLHLSFQPWFNHWAWLIRADDLATQIDPAAASISAQDTDLRSLSGSKRFCHVLRELSLHETGGISDSIEAFLFAGVQLTDLGGMLLETWRSSNDEDATPPHLVAY